MVPMCENHAMVGLVYHLKNSKKASPFSLVERFLFIGLCVACAWLAVYAQEFRLLDQFYVWGSEKIPEEGHYLNLEDYDDYVEIYFCATYVKLCTIQINY